MIGILIIFGLSFIIGPFLPWWSIAPLAFIVACWQKDSALKAFLIGFTGVSVAWLVMPLYVYFGFPFYVERLGKVLSLPHPVLLVVATSLLGGIVAGLSSMSGYYFRTLWIKDKK